MSSDNTSSSTEIKASAATLVLELYKSQFALTKLHEAADVSVKHIEHTEALADKFITALRDAPHALIAQLSLPKSKLTYQQNFAFNCTLFCTLLLLRNRMNLTAAQQIICGVISWLMCARPNIETLQQSQEDTTSEAHERIKTQLIRALSHYQRGIWLDILTCKSSRSLGKIHQSLSQKALHSPSHEYLKLSLYFATQITRSNTYKPRSYGHVFKPL